MKSESNFKSFFHFGGILNSFVAFSFFVCVTCFALVGTEEVANSQSGSLEPPSTAVDGVGDPVPTTQTQPSWDQVLPANERFVLVMGGVAVLDKETGLVWERSPDIGARQWWPARDHCAQLTTGGRYGWRVPSVHELASLVDPNNIGGNPDLPPGHPFLSVLSSNYWSATESAVDPVDRAWMVSLVNGTSNDLNPKGISFGTLCVRGGGQLTKY